MWKGLALLFKVASLDGAAYTAASLLKVLGVDQVLERVPSFASTYSVAALHTDIDRQTSAPPLASPTIPLGAWHYNHSSRQCPTAS